jgi:hypothetical protein
MILQEPSVEFVQLRTNDIVTESGPAAEYCKQQGDTSMTVAQLCYTMTFGNVRADWTTVCGMSDDDPSMWGNVVV